MVRMFTAAAAAAAVRMVSNLLEVVQVLVVAD